MKKPKYKLSVIISARNEGQEVLNTLASLYATDPQGVEVILVNDHSEDWPKEIPEYKGLRVLTLELPYYGLYDAIYKASEIMFSDKLFFCNARCRFTPGWEQAFIKALDAEPHNLFSPTCAVLSYDNDKIEGAELRYGAKIDLFNDERQFKYYQLRAIKNKTHKPVAWFGGMAMNRDWFLKLGGFYPLQTRGAMNAYISFKVWKAGGEVKVLDTVIGNIFRETTSYPVTEAEQIYNYMVLAYVLRGTAFMEEIVRGLKDKRGIGLAKHAFLHKMVEIKFEREKLIKLKKRDITDLLT